jgi:hypothetical protein
MAGIAIIALLGTPTAAVAVDSAAAQHIKHIIDCLGWLLTDLPTHELNCTPSRPFEWPEEHDAGPPQVIRLLSPSAWSDGPSSSESSEESSESSESQECVEPYYSCTPV